MAARTLSPAFPIAPEPFGPESVPTPPFPPLPDLGPRTPTRSRSRVRVRHPTPKDGPSALPPGSPVFDWLSRRLSPAEATLVVGGPSAVDRLLALLFAGNALADGRISLVEGANRFNPYRLAEWGRSLSVDPTDLLTRIRLARAFTAYQLVALVDAWAPEARASRATLLIAHELPELFFASELPEEERIPLLRHVADELRRVAEATRRPIVITCRRGFEGFPGLSELGPRLNDLLYVSEGDDDLDVEGFREPGRLRLVARPAGQRGLDEFLEVDPTEVTAWDGRFRRTARRSRNG